MQANDGHAGQLELIRDTLHMPEGRIVFTQHGLRFASDVTEGELLALGRRLFAVRSYTKWALGSLFAEMIRAREARLAAARKAGGEEARTAKQEKTGSEWAGEFAAAHQIDPKEYREMIGVFTFYGVTQEGAPDLNDVAGLSFEHWREAMWGVDDGKPKQRERAVALLRHAKAQGWNTVAPLRRYIRSESPTERAEPVQAEMAAYSAVFEFRRWTQRELDRVQSYTQERAALVLADLGDSTLSYIDAIREIARGEKRGRKKESFTNGTNS